MILIWLKKTFISNKTNSYILELGSDGRMRIVAGVGKNKDVIKAIESVDFEVIPTESEEELVEHLFNGYADAAIKGIVECF